MMSDRVSDCRTITSDDVDYARREARSLDKLGNTDRGKRGNFGGFNDEGVTTRECCIYSS